MMILDYISLISVMMKKNDDVYYLEIQEKYHHRIVVIPFIKQVN